MQNTVATFPFVVILWCVFTIFFMPESTTVSLVVSIPIVIDVSVMVVMGMSIVVLMSITIVVMKGVPLVVMMCVPLVVVMGASVVIVIVVSSVPVIFTFPVPVPVRSVMRTTASVAPLMVVSFPRRQTTFTMAIMGVSFPRWRAIRTARPPTIGRVVPGTGANMHQNELKAVRKMHTIAGPN